MTHYLLKIINYGRGKGCRSTITCFEDGIKTWQRSGPKAHNLAAILESKGHTVKRVAINGNLTPNFGAPHADGVVGR
jgi:hypothetical protein